MNDPVEMNVQIFINPKSEDALQGYEVARDVWVRRAEGATADQATKEIVQHLMHVNILSGGEAMAEAALGVVSFLVAAAGVPVMTRSSQ